jgi:hypothetical protein
MDQVSEDQGLPIGHAVDIEKPAGTQVVELRDHLLGLSREVSTVFGDVTLLVDNDMAGWIWSEFSPLTRVNPNEGFSAVPETTADTNDGNSARPWRCCRRRR